MDSWKFAAKRAFPDVSSALLSIYLHLAARDPRTMEKKPNLILFIDKFAEIVADVSTLGIGLLWRSNIILVSKRVAFRFSAACF